MALDQDQRIADVVTREQSRLRNFIRRRVPDARDADDMWNWLVPPLFGWREVTFWQALGLLALCRILFGGHVSRSSSRRRTPEERERFRQAMRERFGFGPSTSESKGL
jgi:hypothetical protein